MPRTHSPGGTIPQDESQPYANTCHIRPGLWTRGPPPATPQAQECVCYVNPQPRSVTRQACRISSSRPVSLLTLLDSRNVGQLHDADGGAQPAPAAAPASTAAPPSSTAGPAAADHDSGHAAEAHGGGGGASERTSLEISASSLEIRRSKKQRNWPAKSKVLELLNELLEEMDLSEHAIVSSAQQHIHANEVILTFGLSQTTLNFLKHAAQKRKFQVRPPPPRCALSACCCVWHRHSIGSSGSIRQGVAAIHGRVSESQRLCRRADVFPSFHSLGGCRTVTERCTHATLGEGHVPLLTASAVDGVCAVVTCPDPQRAEGSGLVGRPTVDLALS